MCVATEAEKEVKVMYELYDKSGNFICYRMTKRIKNDLGEYDVLTALVFIFSNC